MFRRDFRWGWLTIFSIFNLVLWVIVAVTIGLAASDKVDLGVETSIRKYRATAIAAWDQAVSRTGEAKDNPIMVSRPPQPARTELAVLYTPTPAIIWPDTLTTTPTPPLRIQATQDAPQHSTPTPLSTTPEPTLQPSETPARSPLLLADPEIRDLTRLDAEMSRSAIGRPVQIRYQEEALNHEIAALTENNPKLPYQNVRVDLKRDQVIVQGSATVVGFPVSTEVVGTVLAEDCLPTVQIETISIAGVLTPRFVEDQIRDMIQEALAWYPPDYPLCLEQIVLEEGRATVYGFRR